MIKQNLVTNNTYTLKDPDHDEIKDGYQLRWVGKNYAKLQENLLPETVIVPDSAHNSQDPNSASQNLFLTGDNLEVLKHLEHAYTGKVDMIYIDPPYNTGSDGFVYNDDFSFTDEQLRDTLGLTDEEVKRVKNIYGKSSHSAWLTFMYPRLKIAKKLLKDSGVIFVSIDDNEQANLKLLMDGVFNEGNFVAQFIWEGAGKNDANYVSAGHDYILCYTQNQTFWRDKGLTWRLPKEGLEEIYKTEKKLKEEYGEDFEKINDELGNWYRQLKKTHPSWQHRHYSKIDKKGIYFPGDISWPGGGGPNYQVIHPITKKPVKLPARGWVFTLPEKMQENIENDKVEFGIDENTVPKLKRYLFETESYVPASVIYLDRRGADKRLRSLFDGIDIFDSPKDENLLKKLLSIATLSDDGIILDFFAGSGTTAHAVMDLNKDGGKRRYLMCTLDEKVKEGSEAEKAGYKTIDEIARERIIKSAKQVGDTSGFRHYRFVKPSITTLDKIEKLVPSPIAPEDMITPFGEKELTGKGSASGVPTILTTWLVDDGYDFTTTPTPLDLAGYTAYYAEGIARLYLIEDKGWTSESCKALLNKLGKNEIAVNMIVVYPYSFNFVDLTEIKNNIKANLDGKPEVYERY